jgi:hypothetical protein
VSEFVHYGQLGIFRFQEQETSLDDPRGSVLGFRAFLDITEP